MNRGIIPHCSRICPPSSHHAHCVYRLLCLLVGTIVNLCRPLRRARSGARAPNRTRAPRDTSCLQPVPVHTASPARASLARLLHGPFQHAQPSPAPPLAGACRRSSSRVGRPLRCRPARRRSARRRRLLRRAPSLPGELTLPAGLCHVKSIMEIVPRGGHFSVIRLWCAGVQICDDPVSGAISADVNEIPRQKIVHFESVHIQVVSRVLTDTCIQFH